MNQQSRTLTALTGAVATLALPAFLSAQSPAARLVDAARVQIYDVEYDSAATLLLKSLDPKIGATDAERIRAYVLLGIAQIAEDQLLQARGSFRQALLIDPALRVDSLKDLASRLVAVFEVERDRLLSFSFQTPRDTTVLTHVGRLQLTAHTSHRASVVLSITSGGAVVWRDSQVVVGTKTLEWDLRSKDGAAISPGDYILLVSARDSLGETAPAFEGRMKIETLPADTQAFPLPLESSAFAPESATLRAGRQPVALARGLAIGAAAALLSFLGPGGRDKADAKSYVVGGALALGGIVGFLTERRVTRPLPANTQRNRDLRERDARVRAEIAQANARARSTPRIRINIAVSTK